MTVAYFRENTVKIEVSRLNESGQDNPDVFGYMTIEGGGAKNQMIEKQVTYQNYRTMMEKLVEESYVPQEVMETLLDAFLEMAYDFVEELVYLTYESEIIEPEKRRSLFLSLARKARESGRLGEYELDMLADYEADMMPQEGMISGYMQLCMTLPNGYEITIGDYGRTKEQTGPNDSVLCIGIRYCNARQPEVFDKNIEKHFSLKEVPELKDLIRQEKQLDTLAKIYFNRFIEQVERRYK